MRAPLTHATHTLGIEPLRSQDTDIVNNVTHVQKYFNLCLFFFYLQICEYFKMSGNGNMMPGRRDSRQLCSKFCFFNMFFLLGKLLIYTIFGPPPPSYQFSTWISYVTHGYKWSCGRSAWPPSMSQPRCSALLACSSCSAWPPACPSHSAWPPSLSYSSSTLPKNCLNLT